MEKQVELKEDEVDMENFGDDESALEIDGTCFQI